MYCDNCHASCEIVSCYSNLYIGKIADTNTIVSVRIENLATGRVVTQDVTTDGSGVVLLTSGLFRNFLTSAATFKVRVFLAGVNQDITMYTDAGTFDTSGNVYNCITFGTSVLYDSSGDMYSVSTQYLLKSE